jgi:hypothetical protein
MHWRHQDVRRLATLLLLLLQGVRQLEALLLVLQAASLQQLAGDPHNSHSHGATPAWSQLAGWRPAAQTYKYTFTKCFL